MGFPIFNQTNNLSSDIQVTVTGNSLSVLNNTYTLPKPVLYMLPQQPTGGSLTYVTNQSNGMVTESVSVSTSINSLDTIMISVIYNNYYVVPNGQIFNAQSVTLQNSQVIATLDPVSMQALGMYNGQLFTLAGNILTGQTMISDNSPPIIIPTVT